MIEPFDEQPLNKGNDDEEVAVDYDGETVVPFGYQKGLGYETDFGNSEDRYEDFIDAVEDEDQTEYPTGGSRPLVSPPSAQSFATDGTDPWLGTMPPAPDHNSSAMFLEMLEVYLATYARDVPFTKYDDLGDDDWLVEVFKQDRDAVADVLQTGESTIHEWITEPGDGLFRDEFPGCRMGPYVSQHLVHDVPIGAQTLDIRWSRSSRGRLGRRSTSTSRSSAPSVPGPNRGTLTGP